MIVDPLREIFLVISPTITLSLSPPIQGIPRLGVFAEFETDLRRERQLEGIAKAKEAGVYRGRCPSHGPNVGAKIWRPKRI